MQNEFSQHWEDEKFCNNYASTWEISVEEVHFGWLAPGNRTLRLLSDTPLANATVLDIGCGMGENLIAISRAGAQCFGVDISKHMIRMAEAKQFSVLSGHPIQFEVQDMRNLIAFTGITFDLILSVYSLEYLRSIKELRDVFATVANRLKPGGTFTFCFSHPLQHLRHANLQNRTAFAAAEKNSMLIYSVFDVVNCLHDCGLTIDRVLEQETQNPSKISYKRGCKFPYHFHNGKNPCVSDYDAVSNAAPHTIIYKTRKPPGSRVHQTQPLSLDLGTIHLWNENWTIVEKHTFQTMAKPFSVAALRNPVTKERYLSCTILDFDIADGDLEDNSQIYIPIGESVSSGQISVSRRSLLGILLKRLRREGLHPSFGQQRFVLREHPTPVPGVFLRRIDPIYGALDGLFSRRRFGVLVFVNRAEPGGGKVGLDSFFPSLGDRIYVLYIAKDRTLTIDPTDSQLSLPGLF